MFDQRKRQRALFQFKTDLGGQRLAEEFKRRQFAPDQPQRFVIQQLDGGNEAQQKRQQQRRNQAEPNHSVASAISARSMSVSGRLNSLRQRCSAAAISPASVSWS